MSERGLIKWLGMTCGVALISPVFFSLFVGYGTELFGVVALGGYALIEAVGGEGFAEAHAGLVQISQAILSVVIFSIVAVPLYFLFKDCNARAGAVALVIWCVFYLLCLFVLFPATDGP